MMGKIDFFMGRLYHKVVVIDIVHVLQLLRQCKF